MGIHERDLFHLTYPERLVDEGDCQRCRELDDRFRAQRRAKGPQAHAEAWFPPLLDTWLSALSDEGFDPFDCPAETLCMVGVTFTKSLAMRDALIVAAIVDDDAWTPELLCEFASQPHGEHTGMRMGDLLSRAFDAVDAPSPSRRGRMERALALCERAGEVVPRQYAGQPFAVAAYIAWWMGSSRSLSLATLASDIDGDISLAGIVRTAVLRRVGPAWTHRRQCRE